MQRGDTVNDRKANIVTRTIVSRTGVAKPDNQSNHDARKAENDGEGKSSGSDEEFDTAAHHTSIFCVP